MTRDGLPLAARTKGELEFLRKAIARRQVPTPLTRVALESCGKGGLFPRLGPLFSGGLTRIHLAAG